jgi:chaperonin GroES
MNIRPLYDRIVVRRREEETTTAGGIFLPGAAAEKSSAGVILAVGEGRILSNGDVRPLAVKVGDRVIFNKYAAEQNAISINGEELLVLGETDVLAVFED